LHHDVAILAQIWGLIVRLGNCDFLGMAGGVVWTMGNEWWSGGAMLKAVALGLAVATAAGSLAHAQQATCAAALAQGCTCAAPITTGGIIAQLTGVQGNVVVSGQANYTPITTPSGLNVGDGIMVGSNGAALVSMGPSCLNHALAPNSSASITQIGSCACLTVRSNPATGTNSGGGGAALAIGAGAGAGVLAIVLSQHHNSPSPVSAP
jgi:hypothetical protein